MPDSAARHRVKRVLPVLASITIAAYLLAWRSRQTRHDRERERDQELDGRPGTRGVVFV